MSNLYGQEIEFRRLQVIHHSIKEAAESDPRAREPYVIRRRAKGHSIPNLLPSRQALRILGRHEPEFGRIADCLEDESDSIWIQTRKCERCGLKHEPVPGDNGLCILCVMEVKKA